MTALLRLTPQQAGAQLETKKCPKCGLDLPRTEQFFRKNSRRGGLQSWCRLCENKQARERAAAHPEKALERKRKWRAEHHEKYLNSQRRYRSENQDAYRESSRRNSQKWSREHRDIRRIQQQNRRARLLEAGGTYSSQDIKKLYELQKGRCWWNTKHKLDKGYHIDHRIPLVKGGSNDISNIVLACPHCNLSKRDKMPEEFSGRLL